MLCCFCKQFNEKSTISISSWSSLRKRKRLPCHGPVLLPFRLFSWIHICDSTRLSEDKPGKKYCRSDNTMFIQRNLNWHDKIFAFFHIYETNLLSIRKRIETFILSLSRGKYIRYDWLWYFENNDKWEFS